MIGELIEWLRTQDDDAEIAEARCDLGGGDVVTSVDYQPSGHDSQPLPGDYLLLVPGPETGSWVVAGWIDPNNAGVAKAGEVRLYARDGDGEVVGELHVTADGEPPDGIAAELIARADRTDAELEKLKTAHNDHTHKHDVCAGGTSAVGPLAGTSDVPDKTYSPEPTGCDKVYIT